MKLPYYCVIIDLYCQKKVTFNMTFVRKKNDQQDGQNIFFLGKERERRIV